MKIKNINFRQTKSDRSAAKSYQNFGKSIKEKFMKEVKKYKRSLNF